VVRSDLNRQVKECFSRCPGHISVKWDNQPSLDKSVRANKRQCGKAKRAENDVETHPVQ